MPRQGPIREKDKCRSLLRGATWSRGSDVELECSLSGLFVPGCDHPVEDFIRPPNHGFRHRSRDMSLGILNQIVLRFFAVGL